MHFQRVQCPVIRVVNVQGFIYPMVGVAHNSLGSFSKLAGHFSRHLVFLQLLPAFYGNQLTAGAPLTVAAYNHHIKWLAAVGLL